MNTENRMIATKQILTDKELHKLLGMDEDETIDLRKPIATHDGEWRPNPHSADLWKFWAHSECLE